MKHALFACRQTRRQCLAIQSPLKHIVSMLYAIQIANLLFSMLLSIVIYLLRSHV